MIAIVFFDIIIFFSNFLVGRLQREVTFYKYIKWGTQIVLSPNACIYSWRLAENQFSQRKTNLLTSRGSVNNHESFQSSKNSIINQFFLNIIFPLIYFLTFALLFRGDMSNYLSRTKLNTVVNLFYDFRPCKPAVNQVIFFINL